jgi:hypothetical protein
MVIADTIAAKWLKAERTDFLSNLDPLTVGLGKAACIVLFVYFALKMIGVAHDDNWALLRTPYGYWWLAEIFLFVLAPGILLTAGVKLHRARAVRWGAFGALAGVVLNRLNVSILMFNWNLPNHFHDIVPRPGGLDRPVHHHLHILLFAGSSTGCPCSGNTRIFRRSTDDVMAPCLPKGGRA